MNWETHDLFVQMTFVDICDGCLYDDCNCIRFYLFMLKFKNKTDHNYHFEQDLHFILTKKESKQFGSKCK
jgi:hypothetical protein